MPVPGYTLGKVLGEGSFAQTRIGHHNDKPDQPVAVKSISRSHPRFNLQAIQKEIAVMQRINHPRCVNLLEVARCLGRMHTARVACNALNCCDARRRLSRPWPRLTQRVAGARGQKGDPHGRRAGRGWRAL
jgi:hypothetical protein